MPRTLLLACLILLSMLSACVSPQERLTRGDDLYLAGQYEAALRQYQMARNDDPTLPGLEEKIQRTQLRVFIARGDRCVQKAEWDAATQAYEEARRLAPDNKEIDQKLERMTLARGNYHFQQGQQLLSQGNPFDAVTELEQALEFLPSHKASAHGPATSSPSQARTRESR